MIRLFALPALGLCAACATVPDAPIVANGPAAAQGTLVPLGQPVEVGSIVVTPVDVVEDSRCPENARCIQAGRLVVSTRIDSPGWRETVPLTLGEPHATHGETVALVAGLPEIQADSAIPPSAYRFAFEGGF